MGFEVGRAGRLPLCDAGLLLLLFTTHAAAAVPDFARDIQPIRAKRCVSCHGSKVQLHGLRLDRRADALKGGGSGVPAIVPGKSAQSLLIKYVNGEDREVIMPPSGDRLKPEEIALLRAWIDGGASWPGEDGAAPARKTSNHWAFQPISRPPVPVVKSSWVRNPIDAFVLEKLEARGWKPSPAAPSNALLRRVYLDLVGLPPTLDEQKAFLAQPERLAELVDDLLARPSYGERWGRHWLDVARFAETNGYERDGTKPNAWRYRDYVINAFNRDKPFNRFILEQLAGDELPDASAETFTALGYYRLGPWDDEPADRLEDRYDQLDDMVSTTSQAFLGLTLGCARCHNHKFEPLTARDYYSMVAIFNGLVRPQKGRADLDLPTGTWPEIDAQNARDKAMEPYEKKIVGVRDTARENLLRSGRCKLPSPAVEAFLTDQPKRTDAQKILVKENTALLEKEITGNLTAEEREAIAGSERAMAELRRRTPDLPRAYYMHEPKAEPPATFLLVRGKATAPGPEVSPAVPEVAAAAQPVFPPPARTSQRRLTLAKWLASAENPLTARVIVNRVWQHHFGEGLVRTPSDFGVMGDKPTHPELLDWLTSWFIDEGWSIKKLHRLILASNTYRMSKAWNDEYGAKDPENRLLWRVPYTRLEVEPMRDSMLAVSGRLNRKMFGPSMYPHIPPAALE
ncbi:MAG: PSD1 and planctomycete cytochrome C domain-containing protein, partial [Bryobacteraceae bacterium]